MASKYAKGLPILDYPLNKILASSILSIESDAMAYGDATASLFTVPANTKIVGLTAVVGTAWDAGAEIALGDGTTSNKYGTLKGSLRKAGSYFMPIDVEETSKITITATQSESLGAGAPGAGSVKFWLHYRPNSTIAGWVN
jgi:hypothetical protein